jgi:hypothetical protein
MPLLDFNHTWCTYVVHSCTLMPFGYDIIVMGKEFNQHGCTWYTYLILMHVYVIWVGVGKVFFHICDVIDYPYII